MNIGEIATAYVKIHGETSDMESELKKTALRVGKLFSQIFGAVAFTQGIRKSIDAAIRLDEAVDLATKTFGKAYDAQEKLARGAAHAMGLTEASFLKTTAAAKMLLDNLGLTEDQSIEMANTLIGLSADMSELNSSWGSAEQITQKFTRSLMGMTRGLRTMGISLNNTQIEQKAMAMGLWDGVGAMSQASKAQAIYQLILEKAGKHLGFFKSQLADADVQQQISAALTENTAAHLGTAFLPIYSKIVQVVGWLAEAFGKLPQPVQLVVVAFVGLIALSGPINAFIALVKSLSTTTMTTMGVIGLLAAAAFTAYTILSDDGPSKSQQQLSARTKEVASALADEIGGLVGTANAADGAVDSIDGLAAAQYALSAALTGSSEEGQALEAALGGVGLQTTHAASAVVTLQSALDGVKGRGNISSSGLTGPGLASAAADFLRGIDETSVSWKNLVKMFEDQGWSTKVARQMAISATWTLKTGDAYTLVKEQLASFTEAEQDAISAAGELGRASRDTDVSAMAEEFLNGEIAASTFREQLIKTAEANTGLSHTSDDAVSVLAEYTRVLETLTPEQVAMYQATGEAAVQLLNAADSTSEFMYAQDALTAALTTTRGSLNDAATAADDLKKAIDEIFSPYLDLEEANRNLEAAIDDLTLTFRKNGDSIDVQTAKGRANRSAIEDNVKAILAWGSAHVGAGEDINEVTKGMQAQRDALIKQLTTLGLSTEAATEYVDALGLTPANITTSVELAKADATKRELETMLEAMTDLDDGAKAEIRLLIDQGKYEQARALLDGGDVTRRVNIITTINGRQTRVSGTESDSLYTDVATGVTQRASGGYADSPQLSLWAEAGAEAILPLTNGSRLRQLLDDPRIGGPVRRAMGDDVSSTAGASVTVGSLVVGSREDYDELMRKLDHLLWRVS